MKPIHVFMLLAFLFGSVSLKSQSSAEKFAGIIQTPEIAAFFDGLFDNLGIVVEETGERVLIKHLGERIEVSEGFDSSQVDFILPLRLENVGNMVGHSEDGKIDDLEATRIAAVFFTPFTRETLKNEVLSANRKRKAAGIEDLSHIYLVNPDGSTAAYHTLIYVSNQWIVLDDIVGKPKRVYRLEHAPALEYQRRIFSAMKSDTKKGWLSFVKWYKNWRDDYSVTY